MKMDENKDNVIKGNLKCRLEDLAGNPSRSIGGGDDYGTYCYLEWHGGKRRWTEYSGGTDGSTYEPYSSSITWEDYTPYVIEEYLEEEFKKMGIEVDLKKFEPLCRHNLNTILEQIAKKSIINNIFELNDGRIVILE